VARLLAAGANLVGVTVLDELACSLIGQNSFYGTPDNPRAPGRFCGGSSCGSAAAVAANACDFALGTDTGGSVRVPAAFTGLLGMRPTHGAIASDGVVPLVPSMDTIGAFARDGELLACVMETLLGCEAGSAPTRIVLIEDAFARADPSVRSELERGVAELQRGYGVQLVRAPRLWSDDPGSLVGAYNALFVHEAWQVHGAWIRSVRPDLGPILNERFAAIERAACDEPDLGPHEQVRARLRSEIAALLTDSDGVLALPTAPCPALYRGASKEVLNAFRTNTLALTAISSLSGAPVLAVPLGTTQGAPVGLSLMAQPGDDARLLAFARSLSLTPPRRVLVGK
jgi:amidase